MAKKTTQGANPTLAPPEVAKKSRSFGRDATLAKPVTFSGASPKTAEQHMAQRKQAGLSHRAIADEFGISKSTSHRKLAKTMQQGFTKLSPAGASRIKGK